MLLAEGLNRKSCFVRFSACTQTSRVQSRKTEIGVFRKVWYEMHTADFVGLYTATGSAEFGPPPLGGPCGPPRTLWQAPLLELDCGAFYFRYRGVLNFGALYFRGECSVKPRLLGF